MTATVEGWAGPVRAGLHEATGGDGTDACSGDMLLEARLAAGTERCCVVGQSLAAPPHVVVRRA